MPILPDHWIRDQAHKSHMITPFVEHQEKGQVISYGLSSYGYDARVSDEFKIFTNIDNAIVDPKNFSEKGFVNRQVDVCIIPPNSFVLGRTVEYFRIPRDVLVICLGKSTYARCGIIVNVTPLEPEWEGHVTLEFSNTTPLPAKVYANEGACQFLFLKADSPCEVSYLDRHGKYMGQQGITLPPTLKLRRIQMDRMHIIGGTPLKGNIIISGAKNAALPLMCASLLTDRPLHLSNVPQLADIQSLSHLLHQHGVEIKREGLHHYTFHAPDITSTVAPYDLVRKMRASILVLGPLLARCGQARVSLPGGCVIGTRPVNFHLEGLRQMGAEIMLEDGYINAIAPQRGLHGASITFPLITVTGTENLMMAAVLAKGTTHLLNAAREPEIVDLATCLIAMGAHIEGAGTDKITIEGVPSLKEATHSVLPDRIETGTYAMAAAITGGSLHIKNTRLDLLGGALDPLCRAGVRFTATEDGFFVSCPPDTLQGTDIMTEPFPGFPTDLQAQMMALLTLAEGSSLLTETIFENRFMQVPELCRMGANITVHGASALVRGQKRLRGAPVMATDLRASVCLVLAGLAAQGETIIHRVYHLDRGYEAIENKLSACGAHIERLIEAAA